MLSLALNVLCSVAFGHVMKWSTWRRANLLWVAACNYVTASALCFLLVLHAPPKGAIAFTAATGAWGGICYLVSLLYYFAAVAGLGMGLATSALRISVAIPVLGALLFWHEQLRADQAIGLLLVAVSLPLLASGRNGPERGRLGLLFGLLLPLFLVTGFGQVASRVFTGGAPDANTYLFLGLLFGSAGVSAGLALVLRPVRPHGQDLWLGVILGAVNLSTNIFLLSALRQLPPAVVFSVSGTGNVLLATLTGVLFWRERLSRGALGGVLLAGVAVVLLAR